MIKGARIRFRAPEKSDLPLFTHWINDPDVTAHLAIYLPMSLALEERWFEAMLTKPPDERPFTIIIKDGEGWRAIGNCGYHAIDWRNRSAELGIMLGDKALWNQGLGTEAVCLLVRHGFETLNLNRIYLRVYAENAAAIRVYEKAGFMQEGLARQGEYRNGRYQDVVWMSILRSEWNGTNAG